MGEYDDMDLSEEEIAALDEDQGDDDNTNTEEDSQGDETDQSDDDGQDNEDDDEGDGSETDDDDSDEGADSDSQSQEDADQDDGDSSEDEQGDTEDDADSDGEAGDQEDGTGDSDDSDAGDSDDSPGDDKQVDVDAAYEEKIKDLDKRLDDGEIDFDGYKKELIAVERERTRDLVKEELTRSKAEETWESEQATFFKDNGYLKDNPIVYDSYAREVNRLIADKAWGKKPGPVILAEAKKNVDLAFGIKAKEDQSPKKVEKKEKTKGQKAVDKAKQSSARRDSPKTLKNVPAADNNTDGAFDYLDNLDGTEYEAAIAKLSPEEMEAYENL